MNVVIIEYGAGNLFSVQTALERLGCTATVSCEPAVIRGAERVLFPGVGQASSAMKRLRECGLEQVIPTLTMPVLGICLGMQLLCTYSEEGDTEGLGVLPLRVEKIVGDCKVPHIGWNRIEGLKSSLFKGIDEGAWMYFVHSYYLPVNSYQVAESDYHKPFCAAIEKDNFFGCQFHPEKSGDVGERMLKNFLEWN
ncbi:imidazole glycerol phosphate synthase subunit HisH [Bacteroidia bacterium]|nr:imidazole glycerol phosphate synthase subunit HisH [Bacteroidia bacterium]